MGGTKIVVLQLKEILKSSVFIVLGLVLIVLLIFLFIPKDDKASKEESAAYAPGVYAAEIILHNRPVNVEVTVSEKEIVSIELKNMEEVQEVFYPLFRPTMQTLTQEIIKKQTTKVSLPQDATETSKILLSAVKQALAKAELPAY